MTQPEIVKDTNVPSKQPLKPQWKATFGFKLLPDRRKIKPIGRLYINGKYLSVKETSNYLKAK